MLPVPDLAAAATAYLAPYLSMAAGAAAKKFGSVAAEHLAGLYGKIKAHLTSAAGQETLGAIEKTPSDPDAHGALRLALKKQLSEDPSFHAELDALLAQVQKAIPDEKLQQVMNITGNSNQGVQIIGDSNQVGGNGKTA